MLQLTETEKMRVRDFCAGYGTLCVSKAKEPAESTVITEANKFFGRYLNGEGKIIIGQVSTNELIAEACRENSIDIDKISAEDDAYQIKKIGKNILIAGANARAVLHAVYALEDEIIAGRAKGDIDIKVKPYFRKRSDALGHYHSISVNLGNDTVDEPKAEYLARLGINQFCACLDGSPYGSNLSDLVHSDVFPFQIKPNPEAVKNIKNIAKNCKKYGIEFYMMLWEPSLPANYAPLEKYPKEALGKVKRPWGGDENNLDTTLCISSPIVQEHYRNIITKFIKEYEDVAGFLFYNQDGGAWICTPQLCERCMKHIIDSDPSKHNSWELQAMLADLLADAAHKANPDFKFIYWSAVHFHGEAVTKQLETAKNYDYIITGSDGADHNVHISFPEEPFDTVKRCLDASKKFHKPLYGYYAFNRLEAVQIGFPTPFTVADSIKTLKRWGIDNLMEVTGPTAALNQITALAMKKFEEDPDADPEEYLKQLAEAQFGKEAGKHALKAWKYAESAYNCWLHYKATPLGGSQFFVRSSTYYGKTDAGILPGVLERFEEFFKIVGNVEPWRREEYKQNETPEFLERYEKMEKFLARSLKELEKAYELAPEDEKIGICYYPGTFEGLGRQTMKEYARLNLSSGQQMYMNCKMKINVIRAVNLQRTIRDESADEKVKAQADYMKLIKNDITVKKEYLALLKTLLKLRPCFTLTGICESELELYKADIEKLISEEQEYLLKN
ncbi:MAG: hypothetical protein J5874_03375 [Oscillospiraceae bacterium]|nr:hypothetical protein [Oscillospiraceae bacterium]